MEDTLAAQMGVSRDEWAELARRGRSIFGTHEWLDTWWRHRQHDLPLIPLTHRDAQGGLRALLPLVVTRRRPTVLQPLGQYPGPEASLVSAPADLDIAGPALARQLTDRADWDLLRLQAVPATLPFAPGRRTMAHDAEPNPVLRFEGQTWEELLASRSRNFRDQVRRRERKLHREFAVRFRRSADPERLSSDIDELLRLHRLRWGDQTVGLTEASERFHRDFLRQALAHGWLSLWFLELDGRPVAVNLNFRFADREIYYQGGRDPGYESHNVGLVLLTHTIREAADAGLEEFRFLRGRQEYKRRLANADAPVESRLAARTRLGTSVLGGLAIRRMARQRLAQLREGPAGGGSRFRGSTSAPVARAES